MNGDYEGLRRIKEVKSLWLTLDGYDQINELINKGWKLIRAEVYHGEERPAMVWVLGKEEDND